MRHIDELKRNSDVCILLGCGSSIDRIKPAQWQNMIKYDLWAVNNWVYHPFIVPDFYHIECKHYDYRIMQRRLLKKQKEYKDVNFIFPKNKMIGMKDGSRVRLSDVAFSKAKKYEYEMRVRDSKREMKTFNSDYNITGKLTKSHDMSLTLLFELIYRMGYKKIVLFGIDLYNSYYFWTNHPEYGEVHHRTNKEHEGKDPKEPHNTHKIKDFIIDFNKRWMLPEGREIFIGYDDTALKGHLQRIYCESMD